MIARLTVLEGPLKGLEFRFEEGTEWTLGQDPVACDFVLEDASIPNKYIKFREVKGEILLTPLTPLPPVQINDHNIDSETILSPQDRLKLGDFLLLFEKEEQSSVNSSDSDYEDIFASLQTDSDEEHDTSAYDSIFEDSEELPDIPFPLTPDTPFLLKVIAGPNTGAEIGIEKGRSYIIGKDPKTSDIIFQDLSVSRSHAKLSVTADGIIEIEDLGSKNGTLVNGHPITEVKKLSPEDLIGLGTSLFLVIDREAPQETLYTPALPSYEAPKQEAPPSEIAPEETKEPPQTWKQQPIPTKYLISLGAFAAVFLVAFLTFFSLFKSQNIEIKQKDPIAHIEEALKKFEDVQFSFNPAGGKIFLAGHVITSVDYLEMRYAIDQLPFIQQVEDNVVIDDSIAKTMNDVLISNADLKGISIRVVKPGRFAATGYLQTMGEMNTAYDYLLLNFPYTDRLSNQIVVEETLNANIQSLLLNGHFTAVQPTLGNGHVVLSGVYSAQKETEYEHVLREIGELAGVTSVKNFALPTNRVPAINLSSQYQVTGISLFDGQGYNVVLNGLIYTIHDSIDGMKISEIEPDRVLLEKDGIKYQIDYTPNYFTR